MMFTGHLGRPPPASPPWPRALAFPREGARLVREEDVYALVADVMMLRAARGRDVTVTPENTVWLMRGAVVMLGAFGAGTGRKEEGGPP